MSFTESVFNQIAVTAEHPSVIYGKSFFEQVDKVLVARFGHIFDRCTERSGHLPAGRKVTGSCSVPFHIASEPSSIFK